MTAWLVRGGRHGEGEAYNIEHGVARIGFVEVSGLAEAKTPDAVVELVRQGLEQGAARMRVSNVAAQLHAFANRMQPQDLIVMPMKSRAQIAIGRVSGPYAFRKEPDELRHVRPVKWVRTDGVRVPSRV